MASIRVLPEQLVNKIAAGEVVERPASVVKELIENSLDSGATRVEVRVEDGGRKSVSVSDDGEGMNGDDLRLAVHPHATSKLADEEALFAIGTLGFRGEAMASIASISHLLVRTRRAADPGGHEIEVHGGQIGPVREVGCAPGTTVEVRDVFFNTPARRKFLRTANTEMGHVTEQVARMALGFPEVHIRLEHNGRLSHDLPACQSLRDRVGELYGHELADALLPVDRPEESAGVALRGLIAPPAQSRSSTKWQYFFLNGRFVRDRFMLHALREAFRGLIDPHRQPVAFLWLDMRRDLVDVNVHPTKVEVRFQDSGLVHSLVLAALRDTLQKSDLSPALATSDAASSPRQLEVQQAIADFFKHAPPVQPRPAPGTHPHHASSPPRHDQTHAQAVSEAGPPAQGADRPFTTPPPQHTLPPPPGSRGVPAVPAPATNAIQLHNTFLVAETEEGMIIVDQHALHERIVYEQLRRRVNDGKLTSQRLLIPEMIDVTPAQLALIEESGELLARLGIEVDQSGPRMAAVQGFPAMLGSVEAGSFVADLLDQLADKTGGAEPEQVLSDLLDMMACKAAIKAGDQLSPQEIDDLLAQREVIERGSNCPHGRPTTLRLTVEDLQKQFGRT